MTVCETLRRVLGAGLPGRGQDGDGSRRSQAQPTLRGNGDPRAASVAESCINYQQGSPHKLFLVRTVTRASLQDIPGRGHKYHLKFSVEEIIQKEVTVNCTAEVLYPPMGQDTAPEVNFTFEGEIGKNPDEEDNTFYQRLKSMKEPLKAQYIPDSFGNVPPEMKPVRHLAWLASGYIIRQNSTENT